MQMIQNNVIGRLYKRDIFLRNLFEEKRFGLKNRLNCVIATYKSIASDFVCIFVYGLVAMQHYLLITNFYYNDYSVTKKKREYRRISDIYVAHRRSYPCQ